MTEDCSNVELYFIIVSVAYPGGPLEEISSVSDGRRHDVFGVRHGNGDWFSCRRPCFMTH